MPYGAGACPFLKGMDMTMTTTMDAAAIERTALRWTNASPAVHTQVTNLARVNKRYSNSDLRCMPPGAQSSIAAAFRTIDLQVGEKLMRVDEYHLANARYARIVEESRDMSILIPAGVSLDKALLYEADVLCAKAESLVARAGVLRSAAALAVAK